jgi:diguanylate cyclase (GGDEF)-like protein
MLARVRTHLTLYRLQRDLQGEIAQRHETELALRKANLELRRLAVLDELTQVANRRRFDEYLRSQWAAGPRQLSVLMCDVDYFKLYNDAYGHQAGDRCLQLVADAIGRALRHVNDLAARYGGEEFAVVLPDTDRTGAAHVAEAIHEAVGRLSIIHGFSDSGPHVTLSIGGATALSGIGASPEALVAAADEALYAAKRAGRNRSVIAAGLPAANEVAK